MLSNGLLVEEIANKYEQDDSIIWESKFEMLEAIEEIGQNDKT